MSRTNQQPVRVTTTVPLHVWSILQEQENS